MTDIGLIDFARYKNLLYIAVRDAVRVAQTDLSHEGIYEYQLAIWGNMTAYGVNLGVKTRHELERYAQARYEKQKASGKLRERETVDAIMILNRHGPIEATHSDHFRPFFDEINKTILEPHSRAYTIEVDRHFYEKVPAEEKGKFYKAHSDNGNIWEISAEVMRQLDHAQVFGNEATREKLVITVTDPIDDGGMSTKYTERLNTPAIVAVYTLDIERAAAIRNDFNEQFRKKMGYNRRVSHKTTDKK